MLKYIVMGARLQLVFARLGDRLLYAVRVFDDPHAPATLWSIVERSEEISALVALCDGERCKVFLFNEVAANVAWSEFSVCVQEGDLRSLLSNIATGACDQQSLQGQAAIALDGPGEGLLVVDPDCALTWNPVSNALITAGGETSLVDLFDLDEGSQQEQIAIWLTDNLHPAGVYHSPQVKNGPRTRELTDIFLHHEYGAILIESKAISVFARKRVPNRKKLASDVSNHVKKAISQLRGGIRKLKSGAPVTSKDSEQTIDVERTQPMHAVVLIPDLSLLDKRDYGIECMRRFIEGADGLLHLLDISELLRIVQAAEMIAADEDVTPMMALDFYLMKRAELAVREKTLCVEVLLRRTRR